MRIGVLIPTRGIVIQSARRPAVDECWAMARHAEAAGYDAVWVGDSIVAKPRLEALTTLAYLAGITTRVYPHLLRHSVATTLLERGMPLEQIQQFLGHTKLETTQIYAASTTAMIKESYQKALGR